MFTALLFLRYKALKYQATSATEKEAEVVGTEDHPMAAKLYYFLWPLGWLHVYFDQKERRNMNNNILLRVTHRNHI